MYKKILLPLDLGASQGQEKAIDSAVQLAQASGATLHLITVVPDFGMSLVGSFFPPDYEQKVIAETKTKLTELVKDQVPATVTTREVVAYGTIYTEILDYAKKREIDLIVMASHRPELKDYLVGPNAARVVRHANCSVMVVRDS